MANRVEREALHALSTIPWQTLQRCGHPCLGELRAARPSSAHFASRPPSPVRTTGNQSTQKTATPAETPPSLREAHGGHCRLPIDRYYLYIEYAKKVQSQKSRPSQKQNAIIEGKPWPCNKAHQPWRGYSTQHPYTSKQARSIFCANSKERNLQRYRSTLWFIYSLIVWLFDSLTI